MYKAKIEEDLKNAVKDLGFVVSDIVLSIPENSKFGDYSSNVALQLAKQNSENSYQSSLEIANAILEKFGHPKHLERIEVAGPGFLNFYLKDESLVEGLGSRVQGLEKGKNAKRILVEFAHPNTHKAFHIGHLRNITIGESICRLLQFSGNDVYRVTYGGDIGPHVAKAIWGILKLKTEFKVARTKPLRERAEFLGKAYALGSASYEEDPKVKTEIDEINRKLYESSDKQLKALWEETKEWSIGYFETIYSRVGTEFDSQIWESEITEAGVKITKENIGHIFEKDEGAIIFPGEKHGLHNRVFITSKGHPTYEGKEMGLTKREQEIFPYDESIHIVANEQESFFEVTTKALELMDPNYVGKKKHLSYGMVNLASGKMSSRRGEVITAEFLIDQVKQVIKDSFSKDFKGREADLDKIAVGAIKFYFLKFSLVSNIAFDIEKSVSLQGDTGPYLQYTYARISSLVGKAGGGMRHEAGSKRDSIAIARTSFIASLQNDKHGDSKMTGLEEEEREVLRQLEFFEGFAGEAADKFQPNLVANYLLNLAKAFNLFYERFPVLGSEREEFRIKLSKKVGETVKLGLYLLGIEVLERM